MTAEELEKNLKVRKLDSLYLLYGEDIFLLETCLKKIKSNFGEMVEGINYIKIDDKSINKLISDIEVPAFGYEKKLIIAKNTGIFKKDTKKKDEINNVLQKNISNYIQKNIDIIRESCVIIFIEQDINKVDLYKTIETLGVICNFEKLKQPQIIKRLKAICNAYKVNVDEGTLMYLTENSGTDMQNLINEIRKLIEYAGKNRYNKKRRYRYFINKTN